MAEQVMSTPPITKMMETALPSNLERKDIWKGSDVQLCRDSFGGVFSGLLRNLLRGASSCTPDWPAPSRGLSPRRRLVNAKLIFRLGQLAVPHPGEHAALVAG